MGTIAYLKHVGLTVEQIAEALKLPVNDVEFELWRRGELGTFLNDAKLIEYRRRQLRETWRD